ncbi:MAG: PAS domain-containing protein, partial [Gemmatimonadota bacterium]|nr:PAS domain-containing protein [Gemmatimonadota bacterium]
MRWLRQWGSAGLGVAMLLLAGATAFWASREQDAATGRIVLMGQALQHHMQGDMMHDGLKGDVYRAQYARDQRDATLQEVAEHAASFRAALAANDSLPLPASIRTALAGVQAPLDRYIALADPIVRLAFQDLPAARGRLASFDAAFNELEVQQEAVSNELLAQVAATQADAEQLSRWVKLLVLALVGCPIAVMTASHDIGNRSLPAPGPSSDPLGAGRLLEAIERADAILLLADRDQRVVAASARARAAIAQLGFASAGVEGADLAAMHGAPAGFREAAAGAATAPHEARLKADHRVYKSVTTALTDPSGLVIGYVSAWEDQTKRHQAEVELGRVLSMIESTPTATICCDPDLSMRYINPAGRA